MATGSLNSNLTLHKESDMNTERTFPRIANIYGAGLSAQATDIELQLLARYDFLIGGLRYDPADKENRKALNARIRRLRELNPDILIIDFSISAPYWSPSRAPQPPEEAFLRTVEGERINGWPGTQMLNWSRPETVDFMVERVPERIEGLDLDGFFIDCMFEHFDSWAVEIESRKPVQIDADGDGVEDSRASLDAAWKQGKLQLMGKLRGLLGDEIVIMINAQRAGDFARPLVNGNYLEDYIDFTITHNWDWKTVLDLYLGWCAAPHQPNCTTINATSSYWPEYNARRRLPYDECCDILEHGYEQLQPMRFGLATALMGDGFYGFDLNTRWRGQHWWYAEFDAPLGAARGPGAPTGDGTWHREFENGLVVVNPRPHRVHHKLPRTYRDYTTGWSGQEFVIPARDGRIYFPVGSIY
jgi:hypothetical protein